MLTIKQITENTDAVIRGLEKKHFKDADVDGMHIRLLDRKSVV